MNQVYIALGSNLGNRLENIQSATKILSTHIANLKLSEIYETEAVGMENGHFHPFMNAVLFGSTNLDSNELLRFLLETELKLGRTRNTIKGHVSRVIDLDLLMFNQLISTDNNLILPHPRMHERIFVLKPLMDLNPELEIPGLSNNVQHFYHILLSIKC